MREPDLETFFRSRLRRLQKDRAEVAGLRREDIIERFAGQPVANSGNLLQALTSHEAGETVQSLTRERATGGPGDVGGASRMSGNGMQHG